VTLSVILWLGAIGISVLRVTLGFLLATGVGLLLALVMRRFARVDAALSTFLVMLQSLPSACWVALATFHLKNEVGVQLVMVCGAFSATALACRSALDGLPIGSWFPPTPHRLSTLVVGLRQGWALSWRALMTAELLSGSLQMGVGTLLGASRANFPQMVLVVLVILGIGLLVDHFVFRRLEQWARRKIEEWEHVYEI
jgi:NitT/TauT family transport system permease protein